MTAMSSGTCGAAPGGGGDPPAGGGGGDNPTGGAVTEKPTTPTLCKAENQGECECKTGTGLATYVEGDVCVLCVYCVLYTVFVLCVIHTGNAPVYILHILHG